MTYQNKKKKMFLEGSMVVIDPYGRNLQHAELKGIGKWDNKPYVWTRVEGDPEAFQTKMFYSSLNICRLQKRLNELGLVDSNFQRFAERTDILADMFLCFGEMFAAQKNQIHI